MGGSIPEQWAEQARYDLDTARTLLEGGRYLYVVFCCQQAAEKMLKAVIADRTGECPPRIHSLLRLAEHAAVVLDERRTEVLEDLSRYYIQSRYPEELPALSRGFDRARGQRVVAETEDVLQWLLSML